MDEQLITEIERLLFKWIDEELPSNIAQTASVAISTVNVRPTLESQGGHQCWLTFCGEHETSMINDSVTDICRTKHEALSQLKRLIQLDLSQFHMWAQPLIMKHPQNGV